MKSIRNLLKPYLHISSVMCYFSVDPAHISIPMPIYHEHGGGGNLKAILAIYIVISIVCFAALFIRYILVLKNEHFLKQSKIKNLFYDLNEYSVLKPDLNIWSIGLIIINGLVLLTISIICVM